MIVPHLQWGLLDQPDDLQFLGGGISHAPSFPTPIALFFQQPVLEGQLGHHLLQRAGLPKHPLTSSEVAARAVSPAGASYRPPEIPLTNDNRGSGIRPPPGRSMLVETETKIPMAAAGDKRPLQERARCCASGLRRKSRPNCVYCQAVGPVPALHQCRAVTSTHFG